MPAKEHGLIQRAQMIAGSLPFEALARNGIERRLESHFLRCSRPSREELGKKAPLLDGIAKDHPEGYDGVLYFHIPFCPSLCSYCGYLSVPFDSDAKRILSRYLSAMKKELGMHGEKFGRIKARHLYFGGGTPSLLPPEEIDNLLGFVRMNAEVEEGAEVTFEVKPTGLEERLEAMRRNGVNRISMGVQSLNREVLAACGRFDGGRGAVESAVAAIRRAGFRNLNIDLIYGLPRQTLEIWEDDLRGAAALKPEAITTYHLRLDNDEIRKMHREQPELFAPTNPTTLTMKIMATEFLGGLGYTQSPTDWFWKDGGVHRAQIDKWKGGMNLLGIGAAAYSSLSPGWKFCNIGSIENRMGSLREYTRRLEAEISPIAEGHKLSAEKWMEGFVKLGLKSGIDLAFFKAKFGVEMLEIFPQVSGLVELGALVIEKGELLLSYVGNVLAEEVAEKLTVNKNV